MMLRSLITIEGNIMSENGLPAIHPGEFLGETLDELHISAAELARILDLPAEQVSSVVQGTSPITAPFALLLARAFDQSAQYWLNLQAAYDLKIAAAAIARQLARVRPIVSVASPPRP